MECPRCKSSSPEGKRYCADCGSSLDASLVHLDDVVRAEVKKTLDSEFKGQKFVDIETSEAIVSRINRWAKLFGFFVGIPLALILIGLGVAGFDKYSDFKDLINSIESQVKPRVEQAKADADSAKDEADGAKKEANEAKETIGSVTEQINKELGSAKNTTTSVQALSDRVSILDKTTSRKMDESSKQVDARMAELDQKIDGATKDIAGFVLMPYESSLTK